jgi:hypothetical protein
MDKISKLNSCIEMISKMNVEEYRIRSNIKLLFKKMKPYTKSYNNLYHTIMFRHKRKKYILDKMSFSEEYMKFIGIFEFIELLKILSIHKNLLQRHVIEFIDKALEIQDIKIEKIIEFDEPRSIPITYLIINPHTYNKDLKINTKRIIFRCISQSSRVLIKIVDEHGEVYDSVTINYEKIDDEDVINSIINVYEEIINEAYKIVDHNKNILEELKLVEIKHNMNKYIGGI